MKPFDEAVAERARACADAIPAVADGLVRRPRLETVLDRVPRSRVTMVHGPPGTGKTTLLTGWGHRLCRELGPGSVTWLDRNRDDDLTAAVVALWASGASSAPSVVVVDDAQLVDIAAVEAAMARMPGGTDGVRLVLGIRSEAFLAGVPLGGGQVVGPEDLWFTADEARALVHTHAPEAADAELDRALAIGAGWAAPLALAARALARRGGGQSLRVDEAVDAAELHDLVAPYLAALPAPARTTLFAVAQPEELEPEEVVGLTGGSRALEQLEQLAEDSPLVQQRATPRGPRWRLHPVLREYLRQRTGRPGPERSAALAANVRAARHFDALGDAAAAVQHATLSLDVDAIVDSLVEHGPTLVALHREDVFDDALSRVPADVAETEPALLAVRALRHRVAGDLARGLQSGRLAMELADRARGAGEEPPTPRGRRLEADRVLVRLWEARYGLTDGGPALAAGVALLTGAVGAPDHPELSVPRRCWTSLELGAVSLWRGDLAAAALWTERAATWAEMSGAPRLRSSALAHRAVIEVVDGAYTAAAETARRSLAEAAAAHLLGDNYVVRAHVAAGWAAFTRMDVESAWGHLGGVEGRQSNELDPLVLTLARVLRGRLLALQWDYEGAWRVLSGRSVRRADLPPELTRLLRVARAEVAVGQRDVTGMRRESEALAAAGWPEDAALFLAVAAMFEGDVETAHTHYRAVLDHPTALPTTGAAAAACYAVMVLITEGRDAARPAVLDMLSRIATSGADVFLAIGLAGGPAFVGLVEEEAQRPGGHPYAAHALERLRHASGLRRRRPPSDGVAAHDGEAGRDVAALLTDRETAVLRCLVDNLSYEETARALYITPNTVKTHVRSLYRKLGVERAGQAVRRARELGVVGTESGD